MRVAIAAFVVYAGCRTPPPAAPHAACEARAGIEAVIARVQQANRAKDIEAMLATFDDEFVLASNEAADKGRRIDKAALRKDLLRDWSIIVRFYEIERWIESVESVTGDVAVVRTNQFYHRTFSRPNGAPGEDDVVTTQRHRETWRRRPGVGWRVAKVEELGGAIYVNGKPFTPEQDRG